MQASLIFLTSTLCLGLSHAYVTHRHKAEGLTVMAVHADSGELLVGATNSLLRLRGDTLATLGQVETGPHLYSPECIGYRTCGSEKQLKLTDSVVKGLVIDYHSQAVIHCNTLYTGICYRRKLSDLSLIGAECPDLTNQICDTVVAPTGDNTFLMLLTNGPGGSPAVYTAATMPFKDTFQTIDGLQKEFSIWIRNPQTMRPVIDSFFKRSHLPLSLKHKFRIDYKATFEHEGFVHWVTVQKKALLINSFETHVSRVCTRDGIFRSYVEVPLRCYGPENTLLGIATGAVLLEAGAAMGRRLSIPYNEKLLYISFQSPYKESVLDELQPVGGLCVYRMRDLASAFTQAVKQCMEQGVGNYGPDYFSSAQSCSKRDHVTVGEKFCGEGVSVSEEGLHFLGTSYVTSNALVMWNEDISTAVSGAIVNGFPVITVGTKEGRILKMSVLEKARVYERLDVTPGQAVRALSMDLTDQHQYILAENTLLRAAVQDCSQYRNCDTCLAAADPHCGWCTLLQRCSLRAECVPVKDNESQFRWLAYEGRRCPRILRMQPNSTHSLANTRQVQVEVNSLPQGMSYQCRLGEDSTFSAVVHEKESVQDVSDVSCRLPLTWFHKVPAIPTGRDSVRLSLSVETSRGQVLASSHLTVFDCSKHDSCTECASSAFPCYWCIADDRCSHSLEQCSRRQGAQNIVSAAAFKKLPGISVLEGASQCPRLEPLDSTSSLIAVAAGKQLSVKLLATHLQPAVHGDDFKCVFSLPSGEHVVGSKQSRRTNIIQCKLVTFDYPDAVGQKKVLLHVRWGRGENHVLDNPRNIQIEMYKCHEMAPSCGVCLTLSKRYNCGYCEGTLHMCSTDCDGHFRTIGHCPNQKLNKILPLRGPTAGGTLVTVEGENLGRDMEALGSRVYIGDVECRVVSIKPSQSVTCLTGPRSEGYAPVDVKTGDKLLRYPEMFRYVIPQFRSVQPSLGPVSGGTTLTLRGVYFLSATWLSVQLKDSSGSIHNCSVLPDSVSDDSVSCVTPMMTSPGDVDVLLQLDDGILSKPGAFRFNSDPVMNGSDINWSFRSGGVSMLVHGSHLNLLQSPLLFVELTQKQGDEPLYSFGECAIQSAHLLRCVTPQLPQPPSYTVRDRRQAVFFSAPLRVVYGVQLSTVTPQARQVLGPLTVHPDPMFQRFKENPKIYRAATLEIVLEGSGLLPLRSTDLIIALGTGRCNFTSVSTSGTRLYCRPPSTQPMPNPGDSLPQVIVQVGTNLNFTIGALMYEIPEEGSQLNVTIIVAVAVSLVAFVVLVFIVVIVKYRQKSARNSKYIRDMQSKMEQYERQVATECKEAFTELQTDNPELSGEPVRDVPWLDFRSFCMRVLFPLGGEDHPVLNRDTDNSVDVLQTSYHQGVASFSELLLDKRFLLTYISALEADRSFNMRERVNVASLLSVALLPHMEYQTDILRTLLKQLIDQSVNARSHTHRKLLLRRTESVTEKMVSNWFTFMLYGFLRESAGKPLYKLFRAIKQQVDKGPVDQITGEAKYSLSEDKLIRQQIDFKQLTVHVPDLNTFLNPSAVVQCYSVQVKVLDCDTISQVKDKILDTLYRSAPKSERPNKDSLDLEWKTSTHGKTILMDEDIKTNKEGNWKRLNTLLTYSVPEGACLALVPRQQPVHCPSNSVLAAHEQQTVGDVSFWSTNGTPQVSWRSPNSGASRFDNVLYHSVTGAAPSPKLKRHLSPSSGVLNMDKATYFHLVKPDGEHRPSKEKRKRRRRKDSCERAESGERMVSEIYLSRLLATKGTLQPFVKDLMDTVLCEERETRHVPAAICYMFQFLDDQAAAHGITDTEVVHTWKSNSLPLRFWVNIIKNPQFVFDVSKSGVVDSCLSVIAQTLMDSCSFGENHLSRDSPSSKLLYANEVKQYKQSVRRYYAHVQSQSISQEEMGNELREVSRDYGADFNTTAAVRELFKYAKKYRDSLLPKLRTEERSRYERLQHLL